MKIIVSRCLLGHSCRYDGRSSYDFRAALHKAGFSDDDIIDVCPESDGGLPTPRVPSEIINGDGTDVLNGRSLVMMRNGRDSTSEYLKGARLALDRALLNNARIALLKAKSPSCGCGLIYDGTFSGTLISGDGVTTALFRKHGIRIFSDQEISTLFALREDGKLRDC